MPVLEVRICGARKLKNTQLIGKIDPFCVVSLEGKQYHSRTANNTTDPVWDDVFKFNIKDENSSRLHFVVWNKNLVADDFLGEYFMSISGLIRGEVLDKWVLLQNCKGNAELHVRVCALDFGLAPSNKAPQPVVLQAAPQQVVYAAPPLPPHVYQQPAAYAVPQGYPQAYPQGYAVQQQAYPPQVAYPTQAQGYPPVQGYPPQAYMQAPAGYPQPGLSPHHGFNPVPTGAL